MRFARARQSSFTKADQVLPRKYVLAVPKRTELGLRQAQQEVGQIVAGVRNRQMVHVQLTGFKTAKAERSAPVLIGLIVQLRAAEIEPRA